MKVVRTRADLAPGHSPLRVYGNRMCGECQRVKAALEAAGIPFAARDLSPEEMARGAPRTGDAWEEASVMAALALRGGLLPVVLTVTLEVVECG